MEPVDARGVGRRGADAREAGAIDPRYPLHWRVELGGMRLKVAPLYDVSDRDLSPPTWSGVVGVRGEGPTGPLTGAGFLELTGYLDR